MKNSIKRSLLGLFSSVLLAVGLTRAAGQLDPVVPNSHTVVTAVNGSAPDTVLPCAMDENGR